MAITATLTKQRVNLTKERSKETLSLEERIRQRAYELYVQGGNESGSELDDWLQAEEEIRQVEEQRKG